MSRRHRAAIVCSALLLVAVAGCGKLKEALTSHTDVAARAGSAELSATKLAAMMSDAQMPPRKELASAVANLWVNYQMLAQAAASGDTLADASVADDAMWAQFAQIKLRKLAQTVLKDSKAPSAADLEKAYTMGEGVLVARHILVMADQKALKPNQIDSARKVAENVKKQLTPANFVSMVKKYSADPGSKDAGGEYVFPAGQMVPEFEKATRALKPGEMSDLVQTAYGFHIILRETYAEAKAKYDTAYTQVARQKAESTWLDGVDKANNVKVKDGAAKLVKSIADNLEGYRDNRTVVATSRALDLRAARVAGWIAAFPPQQRIRQQLQQAPDSVIPLFIQSLMRQELLLRAADSAKIGPTDDETKQIREAFHASVKNSMGGLQILPAQLADSSKGGGDRAAIANARIDSYFGRLLKNQAQFVDVSEPVAIALRHKYDGKVTDSGLERAVTLAGESKAKADSAAAASMPATAVPMPGGDAPKADPAKADSGKGNKKP